MGRSYSKLIGLSIFSGACLLIILWMVIPVHSGNGRTNTSGVATSKPLPTPIVTGAAITGSAVSTTQPEVNKEKDPKASATPSTTYKKNFSDSAFIGDKMLEALEIYGELTKASYFTEEGLMVNDADQYIDQLKSKPYKRIYIQFGLNELGWPDVDDFTSSYKSFVEQVITAVPDAKIYICSIFPVSSGKTSSIINNEHVNEFNTAIKKMVKKMNGSCVYLNIGESVADSSGALPERTSDDGIHLNRECTEQWIEYMRNNE